ncbi:MAG: YchF/TatD family DNA exonuclease [Candidatus Hydrogenedens sp.]|nr:YchF/TatD family DNA exonuclease [Candidatus Hydrogenedens sp.]
MTRLADTHCHLNNDRFLDDFDAVTERTLEALDFAVCIGIDADSCKRAVEMTRPRLYAAVGYHPYHASELDDAAVAMLRHYTEHPRVVALGEMGLDYFNEYSPRADQQVAFERQIELAIETQYPIIIHNRDADADCHATLSRYADRLAGCVMHCYGADAEFARKFLDLGFYISFAGNVTYPKAQVLRDAAAVVPMDRLLVETDCPYLAPQPVRGKRCEPAHVLRTGEALAELKGMPFDEFAEATTENARRFFRLDDPAIAGA